MWTPLEALGGTMHRRICPLYTFDDATRVQVVGSAIPFNSNGFRVLITATHVLLLEDKKHSRNVFTMGEKEPRFLSGRRAAWEYRPGVTADLDLTLVELTTEEANDLEGRYQFATPADIGTAEPKTPGIHYVITGYPASQNRFRGTRYYPAAVATHLITGDITGIDLLDLPDKLETTHFAISVPFEMVPRTSGGLFRLPKASGMSGGAIWKTYIDIPEKLATTPQLVGVGIEHRKAEGVFVATRIQHAMPLLRDLKMLVETDEWPRWQAPN